MRLAICKKCGEEYLHDSKLSKVFCSSNCKLLYEYLERKNNSSSNIWTTFWYYKNTGFQPTGKDLENFRLCEYDLFYGRYERISR